MFFQIILVFFSFIMINNRAIPLSLQFRHGLVLLCTRRMKPAMFKSEITLNTKRTATSEMAGDGYFSLPDAASSLQVMRYH